MSKYIDSAGVEIDASDLPEVLLAELSCVPKPLEKQILSIIPQDGSEVNLDQILIDLYRHYGVLKKRRFMQGKLYRMDEICAVEGTKGRYTLHPALVAKPKN